MVPSEFILGKKDKLLQKALNNPKNLRYDELVTLIEQFGLKRRQNSTSHAVYKWDGKPKFSITIQNKKGMAVPYQVKQFLNHLRDQGWLGKEEE